MSIHKNPPSIPSVLFEGVQKRFGKGPIVLDNINASFPRGSFVSFIGPSGCGKSTFLKLIAGLIDPTEGKIEVEGMTPANAREDLFFVFQDANLLPWLRVRENVELPMKIRGESKKRMHEQAEKMTELVGLKDSLRKYPWQLSGGMKMRVSIARALSIKPHIMLLDEPFGALDEMTRDKLNEDLLKIREVDPFTAFFVTHSVSEAVFLSSHIVVLSSHPGRIAEIIEVPFDYPRSAEIRESQKYLEILAHTAHSLRSVKEEAA